MPRISDTEARIKSIEPPLIFKGIQKLLEVIRANPRATVGDIHRHMVESQGFTFLTREDVTMVHALREDQGDEATQRIAYAALVRAGSPPAVIGTPAKDVPLQMLKFLREQPHAVSTGTFKAGFPDLGGEDFDKIVYNLSNGDQRVIRNGATGWYCRNDKKDLVIQMLAAWDLSWALKYLRGC